MGCLPFPDDEDLAEVRRLSLSIIADRRARDSERADKKLEDVARRDETTLQPIVTNVEVNVSSIDKKVSALSRDKARMKFDVEVGDKLCSEIAAGSTLKAICEGQQAPSMSRVRQWLAEFPDFAEKMRAALELRLDLFEDEVIRDAAQAKYASAAQIPGLRLSIETRLRYLRAKRASTWADRPQTEITIAQQFLANPPSVSINPIKATDAFAEHKREAEARA